MEFARRTWLIVAAVALAAIAIIITVVVFVTGNPSPAASPAKFATVDEFATAWNKAAGWPDDEPLMHKLSLQLSSGCLAQKAGTTPQQIVANADDIWQGMTRRGSMTHDQFVGLLTASTALRC